jgi:hypothetical protein
MNVRVACKKDTGLERFVKTTSERAKFKAIYTYIYIDIFIFEMLLVLKKLLDLGRFSTKTPVVALLPAVQTDCTLLPAVQTDCTLLPAVQLYVAACSTNRLYVAACSTNRLYVAACSTTVRCCLQYNCTLLPAVQTDSTLLQAGSRFCVLASAEMLAKLQVAAACCPA